MSPLDRPLIFGDREQIDALQSMIREEERKKRLKRFEVEYTIELRKETIIEAETEDEATEIIRDNVESDYFSSDCVDVHIDSVIELKNDNV